jgi:hypothetical protein
VKSETPAPQPVAATPEPALGMLVPVARPAASRPSGASAHAKATGSGKGGVRRLPSLDQAEPPAADSPQSQPGDQVPIYPATITR